MVSHDHTIGKSMTFGKEQVCAELSFGGLGVKQGSIVVFIIVILIIIIIIIILVLLVAAMMMDTTQFLEYHVCHQGTMQGVHFVLLSINGLHRDGQVRQESSQFRAIVVQFVQLIRVGL